MKSKTPNSDPYRIMRIIVSTIAILLASLHMAFPDIELDLVTLTLIVIAALPWLTPLVRSMELPGGFKIELHDLKAATDKVTSAQLTQSGTPPQSQREVEVKLENGEEIDLVPSDDPNLALVALRIELEKVLSQIAENNDVVLKRPTAAILLNELSRRNIIQKGNANALSELIALGNQAAHGAEVSPEAAMWALDVGPAILRLVKSWDLVKNF
ncbi:MAG: hypothetical protein NPIRA01_18910 [Nitrospirales bacterium]|nr:MAG: hypothetical protein NPIRA01_18910 [Nitrospirales bacterium]